MEYKDCVCMFLTFILLVDRKAKMSLPYSDHYLCSTANSKKLTCIWSTLILCLNCLSTVFVLSLLLARHYKSHRTKWKHLNVTSCNCITVWNVTALNNWIYYKSHLLCWLKLNSIFYEPQVFCKVPSFVVHAQKGLCCRYYQ